MSYLLDTNIVSEVRKGPRCDRNVARWFAAVPDADVFISALVLGELRKGVLLVQRKDAVKAAALELWLAGLHESFSGRVINVDGVVAERWGQLAAVRTLPVIDGLMAATALVHGMTFVTRNIQDVAGLGVTILDPFAPA